MARLSVCPCGSEKEYAECCGVFHRGEQVAQTPEQLMRSRYSAFAKGLAAYLSATWHASTQPRLELADNPEWVKLEIIDSWQRGNRGFVSFRAYYRANGELGMLAEDSDFVRENERWFYVSGKIP